METDALREALKNAGLTQYEASGYIALIELGTAPAVEVAEASDVPQARIYDVLRNLESKGYVETYQHGSLHARAHDPSQVLEELYDYAASIEDAAEEIKTRWDRPKVENHKVSIVKRFSTVFDRAVEAIEEAGNEIEIAVTPSTFERLEEPLAAARDDGVVVKLSITPEGTENVDHDVYRSEYESATTETRYRDLPTPFLALVDRTQVFFSPETNLHPTNEYGVLVNDYSLSRVFDWYFQTALWDYWEVVYSARDEELPAVYTNMRECIRSISPLHGDGHRVIVSVYGKFREGDEDVQLTGTVEDIVYTGRPDANDSPPLASFVEEASLTVEAGDGVRYTVGGWGALFEDVEAQRIVVEAVD